MTKPVTLRLAPVTLSFLNPQTNSYQQLGRVAIVAARIKEALTIMFVASGNQPVAAVLPSPDLDWAIQNNVYCSFVDANRRRLLTLFESANEARIFTAIALSGKLGQDPICIVNSGKGPINGNDRFAVKFACYDLQQAKVDSPVMAEEHFEIGPADDTPLRAIATSGTYGSVFLVRYPHNVIGIVESLVDERAMPVLPTLGEAPGVSPGSDQSDGAAESSARKSRRQRPSEAAKAAPAPASAEAPPVAAAAPPPAEAPAPRPAFASNAVQPQPMYDSQLESIRNEMQARFGELSQMIASLRRTQAVQSNVALTSDVLVSSVQRLLKENQAKDQLIAEKQQLIDLLNERHTDTRERDAMRIQLAELGSKLSAQRGLTREKMEQQKALNSQIEELQAQIVKAKVDAESRLAILHEQLEAEKKKQADELEQARRRLELNVKQAEEEVGKVREQFERVLAENKTLKSQTARDVSGELKKMQEAVPGLVQRTVKQIVSGVYEMIQDNFDEESDYDGQSVMKAISTALQAQGKEMLEQIDPQEDEEEDD
jgi:predicted  nucleic acid-binding Zn-ribbon protein